MLAIFSGYQMIGRKRREREKKECIFPQIALQHCRFASKFFSPAHLIAKEN